MMQSMQALRKFRVVLKVNGRKLTRHVRATDEAHAITQVRTIDGVLCNADPSLGAVVQSVLQMGTIAHARASRS